MENINSQNDIPDVEEISIEMCCICHEELDPNNPTNIKLRCECNQTYHQVCIYRWLTNNNTCPCCRAEIYDEDEYINKITEYYTNIIIAENTNLINNAEFNIIDNIADRLRTIKILLHFILFINVIIPLLLLYS